MDAEAFDRLRAEVSDRAMIIVEEHQVEELLDDIERQAEEDLSSRFGAADEPTEETDDLSATLEAWAALASHVTLEAYARPVREVGAMHLRLAGWSRAIGARLASLTSSCPAT